jgi:hypothetical protein
MREIDPKYISQAIDLMERHRAVGDAEAIRLDTEVIQRLWALYDAAKAISEQGDPTVDAWVALYVAVANVPESARTP